MQQNFHMSIFQSEKVKTLLSNARFGRLSCQTDPYAALLRDSEHVKEDVLNEQIPMKNAYETQLIQLEELIIQQRKQVQALKIALDDTEQRFVLVKKKNKFIFFRINEFYFSWLKNLKMKKKKKFDYKYFKIN